MRSADGLDACLALSTACPNAASGRVAAAPAIAQVARKVRRPLLVFFMNSSLLQFEDVGPAALRRSRAGVNGSGLDERRLGLFRRRIEDHFDGVANVTVRRTSGAAHNHP